MISRTKCHAQAGFSLMELLIAMSIMLVLMGVVFTFARDSMRIGVVAMEMTEAQESARTAHEYISRDLITAGDGLNGINTIRVPVNFARNFLTINPVTDPLSPGNVNLPIITSDNDVAVNTPVPAVNPVVMLRTTPTRTDRLTILRSDSTFIPVALLANAINVGVTSMQLTIADVTNFNVGDIIFITSNAGGTFATVTARNLGTGVVSLGPGDFYGLNQPGNAGPIGFVTANGTLPVSVMRMQMIHYFVNANGLLIRRLYGLGGGLGFRDSVIAEHVTDLQFKYALNLTNANGTIQQPVTQLATSQQQVSVRQVETTIRVETTHVISRPLRRTTTDVKCLA